MAKKLSGNGWSFEPARDPNAREEVVSLPADRQRAKVRLEKRAKGKEVTAVTGFVLSPADRKALAAKMKKACGAGGGDSDGMIEIQGDHRDAVAAFLASLGWRVG